MGVFKFRKFDVRNEKSAMKVNTDGVLLGALMTITGNERHLLDIGTGTGTIALMAAQRLSEMPPRPQALFDEQQSELSKAEPQQESKGFLIDAIDIDEASAEEAGENFRDSLWARNLHVHHCPLSEFSSEASFDLVFSNPPFFTETLHSPSERKARARHADALPLEEIMVFAALNLTDGGRLSLVLPSDREKEASELAARHGLRLLRLVDIHGSDRKPAYRVIMEFSRNVGQKTAASREKVTINMNGKYSEQYLNIVSDFLLISSRLVDPSHLVDSSRQVEAFPARPCAHR